MQNSQDALLYAAATIVSGQIAAKVFSTDLAEEKSVASALAAALKAVEAGIAKWEEDKARDAAAKSGQPPDLKALAEKLRNRGARKHVV